MIAENSPPAILVCAILVVSIIALSAPAALAANPVHVRGKHMALPRAQVRQPDYASMPQAPQVHKDVHDPFASMLLE